jgi:hypothetical protein
LVLVFFGCGSSHRRPRIARAYESISQTNREYRMRLLPFDQTSILCFEDDSILGFCRLLSFTACCRTGPERFGAIMLSQLMRITHAARQGGPARGFVEIASGVFTSNCDLGENHTTAAGAGQLDDGIGDTFVGIDPQL